MRGLTPRLRSLSFQRPQLSQRRFQFAHATRGFALLQACVSGCTCANPVAAQLDELPTSDLHDGDVEVRTAGLIVLQLLRQTEMQMTPFPHDFRLVISLLPAVQPVLGC
jgi:hypothetical protein